MMYTDPDIIPSRTLVYPLLESWHPYKLIVDSLFMNNATMTAWIARYIHVLSPGGKIFPKGSNLRLASKVIEK